MLTTHNLTIAGVFVAKEKNDLYNWTLQFLTHEGNKGLVEILQNEDKGTIDLIDFPLRKLQKIDGPEDVTARQTLDVWEDRVSRLTSKIKEGYMPVPLIVTDFWRPFEIADGNHRHEAFLRNGIKKYWTIFFTKNEVNRKLLTKYKKHSSK